MDQHQLRDGLLDLINGEVSLDPSTPVEVETDLLLTGLVDSLGIVEVVAWLEEQIGKEIDPADIVLANFQTVGRMLAFADRVRAG